MERSGSSSDSLRQALRHLAAEDAIAVVTEARERARARATRLIEEALVEEVLDAVAELRERAAEDEPTAQDPVESTSSEHAWWIYCVVPADQAAAVPAELEGVEPASTVEIVREGELAALVSAVPGAEYGDVRLRQHLEDLDWVSRTARRHEAVLEVALEHATIVPLRLCTLYRDQLGVRRLLRDHAVALKVGLAKVKGCAEWGVKVFAAGAATEEGDRPDPRTEGDQDIVAERPGATYLLQRRREREHAEKASALRAVCAQTVHERISGCAREAITNPPQRPEVHGREMAMLLNGAYLVADDRRRELYQSITALQSEWNQRGFEIELTGPWPAYNFVSEAAGLAS